MLGYRNSGRHHGRDYQYGGREKKWVDKPRLNPNINTYEQEAPGGSKAHKSNGNHNGNPLAPSLEETKNEEKPPLLSHLQPTQQPTTATGGVPRTA